MFACFLPPGKQTGAILANKGETKNKFEKDLFSFQLVVPPRVQPLDLRIKKIKKFTIERKFIKDSTVFKDWVVPNYKAMVVKDISYSKVHKIVKDPQVLENITEFFFEHVQQFLDIFFDFIGRSAYP